jgi:hypothetical protein
LRRSNQELTSEDPQTQLAAAKLLLRPDKQETEPYNNRIVH